MASRRASGASISWNSSFDRDRVFFLICGAAILGLSVASAQPQQPSDMSAFHLVRQPYDIETFGAFRMLVLHGDFGRKVDLATVMAKHPITGVGALADARGEITIFGGKLFISYGRPDAPHPPADAEGAALLAVSGVQEFQSVLVERDVAPDDIEAFIAQTAAAQGLDPEGPFPFHLFGTITAYVMHVNAAPTNGPHGMGQPVAITVEKRGDAIGGTVAGFYASRDLVGIVSHGGTRTH